MEPHAHEPAPPATTPAGPSGDPGDEGAPGRPSTRRGRHRIARVAGVTALAAGLAAAGGSVAYASTGTSGASGGPSAPMHAPGARPTAVGTVASVGTSSFVLTTRSGSQVTVNVTGQTTYHDPKVSSPSFSDVTTGAHVAVIGTTSSSTVTATTVLIGMPPHPGPDGPPQGSGATASGAAA